MRFLAQKSGCFLLSVQNFCEKLASRAKNYAYYKKLAQRFNVSQKSCQHLFAEGRL